MPRGTIRVDGGTVTVNLLHEENGETMPTETGQTIAVDVPAELQEQGGALTRQMVEDGRVRLQARPDGVDTMWTIPTRMPDMQDAQRRFNTDVQTVRDVPANQLERNRTGQLIVEVDLNGGQLNQGALDYAHQRLCAAIATNPGETFELHLKRFSTTNAVPRLIADTGVIYDLLVKLIDEREDATR